MSRIIGLMIQYSGCGKGEEIGFFGSILHSWHGGCSFTCCHFSPMGEVTGWILSWSWAVLPWRDNASKIKLFLLSSPVQQNCSFLFFLQWCVETSLLKSLDFHKGSFIHGWLSKTEFSRLSWTMIQMGRSRFIGYFRIHSWNQSLPVHMWAGLFLGLWAYGTGWHNAHKGTFDHGMIPNRCR